MKKKARLVARGYQQPSLGNENILAPVARLTTLRVLLSITVEKGMHIHQLDVKLAFLKSNLPVSVFLKPPDGLKCSDMKLLKVVKVLYGLKQSPKALNDFVNDIFVKIGFLRSQKNPCLYFKGLTFILVWVDDFLIVSDSSNYMENLKFYLQSVIDVRDLTSSEELQFLGINILRLKIGNIFVNQTNLIQKIICRFNMTNCKPSKIPIQPTLNLMKSSNINVDFKVPYKELILMYLMLCTHPGLCFCVSYFGRFQICYDINTLEAFETCY